MIPWDIIFWIGDIWHVVMFKVLCYNANISTPWWEIDIDLKYMIFYEGMFWEVNFYCWKGGSIFAKNEFRTWGPSFTKFIVMFIKFFRWTIFEFLRVWVPPFHCSYYVCITNELSFLCSVDQIFRRWGDGVYIKSKGSKFMDARILTIPCKMRLCIL